MKKIIIILILLTLTGCTYNSEIKGKITEIKYNDLIILKEDYNKIKSLINEKYNSNKPDEKLNNELTIKTKENIYYYTLSDNYISINNYYSENNKLNNYLKELEKKYKDTSFYKINYTKNINENETVSLDKTSNYIVINLTKKIKNFKINQIDYDNGKYTDIDLLYCKENIDNNIIIRKTINLDSPDIRISFENEYNYLISIIPLYTKDGKLEFKTTYMQK